MVIVSPLTGDVPLRNRLNGFYIGVTNHILTEIINPPNISQNKAEVANMAISTNGCCWFPVGKNHGETPITRKQGNTGKAAKPFNVILKKLPEIVTCNGVVAAAVGGGGGGLLFVFLLLSFLHFHHRVEKNSARGKSLYLEPFV